ncbi:trypsin-like peptidase domain-containing protein [Streptomyces sp. NBC_01451]|uniref:trypsin-like peptidase domain-containing protein n=1 Tax=Streptomyces sp. NBC_01451 TaxID=2903872 RepID=UPI002E370962|nr:trypsin-like peptidase domain-containing protein [Streptomyces sp. NBC_01451]
MEDLLRAATLALEVRSPGGKVTIEGTGFLIAPGTVITCAHVVADHFEELPDFVRARTVDGSEFLLEPVPEWYVRRRPGDMDLAFLRAPDDMGLPHVLVSDLIDVGDWVWTFGYPAGMFRAGQSALLTVQGASRLRAVDKNGRPLGVDWQPQRVFGTPVGGGYSGSAVLNRRTGAVCGLLCSSDKAGSAHMVSAGDLLSALPQLTQVQSDPTCNIAWLDALDDDQIRLGGWRYPGPRLRVYLDMAVRATREHSYPGALPGVPPPPPAAVHLRQRAQAAPAPAEAGAAVRSPLGQADPPGTVLAQEILENGGDALVVAGPGGGKSTLLRTGLISLAERWRAGHPGLYIPVLVRAADLAAPLAFPDAVAAGVTKELRTAGLTESWPGEFFATRPLRGVDWLVLIDGLDEMADHSRAEVVTMLGALSKIPSSPYRFVGTMRPLAPGALGQSTSSSWTPARYELLPFTTEDLGRFVEQWFTSQNLPEPRVAAADFSKQLQRRDLEELARTPLMATMLCQLYTVDPDRQLPDSRGRIYQAFVDLLHKRQRAGGLRARTQAALQAQDQGQAALNAAERTLDHLPELVAYLASAQHDGNKTRAIDLLAAQPEAARPKAVPLDVWETFLEESLRGTGLVTVRDGDAVFLHRTLLEYFAACHATRDRAATARTFRTLNRPARYGLLTRVPGFRPRIWGLKFWRPPEADGPLVGFVLDLGQRDGTPKELARLLRRLAKRSGIAGCAFIAAQVQLGTHLPPDIPSLARETLRRLLRGTGLDVKDRIWAASALTWLGDAHAAYELGEIARTPDHDTGSRVWAAAVLAELGDAEAADLLVHLATVPGLFGISNLQAARALVSLRDERASATLRALAHDQDLDSGTRMEAAESLAKMGDPSAADTYWHLAHDPALDDASYSSMGRWLFSLGYLDAVDPLWALTHGLQISGRLMATGELAALGDRRGTDLLAVYARDGARDDSGQVWAASALASLGDPRGPDALTALALDPALSHDHRVQAAIALSELEDPRADDLLAALSSASPDSRAAL